MAKENKAPRKRILEAAISLFAQKGFDGVGVREIAKAADVNIAMISYYYRSKVGILREIINTFHIRYYRVIKDVVEQSQTPEESVRLIVRNIIRFVKKNKEMTMVAFDAPSLDIPEIADLKAEKISELIKTISGLIERFELDPTDAVQISIIGPSLMAMILAHFRFKTVQKRVFKIKFDKNFYDQYAETISHLFLYGVTGLANQRKARRSSS